MNDTPDEAPRSPESARPDAVAAEAEQATPESEAPESEAPESEAPESEAPASSPESAAPEPAESAPAAEAAAAPEAVDGPYPDETVVQPSVFDDPKPAAASAAEPTPTTSDDPASDEASTSSPSPAERTTAMTAVDEDLARTQQLPSLDEPPSRSTDREAARARAAARSREEALAAQAAAEGAAVAQPAAAGAAPVAEPHVVTERRKLNTDKFIGAFGLFVLRLVAAAIMGVHGVQALMNLSGTQEFFGKTMLPYSNIFAIATAVGEVLIAVALIVGLLVRVAGLGMLAIGVGALVLVIWAPFNLFGTGGFAGSSGMTGERELLIAGVGLLFLCIGGGGWGVDRMFRSNKSKGLPDDEDI